MSVHGGPRQLLGYQAGPMTRGVEPRQFAGQRMLVAAALFAIAAAVLRTIVAILTNGFEILSALTPVLLMLAAMLFVWRLILGRWAGTVARTAVHAGTRLSGAVVGAVARPLPAHSIAGRVRTAIRRGRIVRQVPLRRFRLRPVTGGGHVHCLLRGEPDGAEPHDGDVLRLTGRHGRSGEFVVQRIEVLRSTSGPVLRVINPGHSGG